MDQRRLRQWIVGVAAVLLAPSAALANGIGLYHLADRAAWPGPSPVLLPLCLGGLTAYSIYEWRMGTGESQQMAQRLTWAAMAAEIAGTAAGHYLQSNPGAVLEWYFVVAVGAAPVLALAAFVHLLVAASGNMPKKAKAPKPAPKVEHKSEPTPTAVEPAPVLEQDPEPEPVKLHAVANIPKTPEEKVSWVVQTLGPDTGKAKALAALKEAFGESMNGQKYLELIKEHRESA